ncbi:MAG TPA: 2,3-bisphosphoglycerate-independent phosphoglycerate mutase, partial [Patescibacteria group bacterium]|nr:2,3-bisphosphoglycerate-independent phosphoglycerate mutase [Patescibacteria group bacterium]
MTMNKQKIAKKPLILIILDGWGLSGRKEGNAVAQASTPCIDKLQKKYPFTTLHAHGKYVGLPAGQVGNSEAGHMNIGAGRVVEQDAVRINRDVINGNFFKNSALLAVIKHVRKNNSKLHLMGLVSNGMSPHSDIKHLIGLLELARRYNIKKVYLHLFTDGRDSPQYQAAEILKRIQSKLQENEEIATIMGRFYAMDRKKKWNRTNKAYHALVTGEAPHFSNPHEGIVLSYNRGETDEFVEPFIVQDPEHKKRVNDHDGAIFFNLRSDRARQLTKAFVQKKFNQDNPQAFKRKKVLKDLKFVAMTNFGPELGDILTAYPDIKIDDTLPEALGDKKQVYMAETEKYAHVSYFFNGGKAGKVNGED